jgi:transcriptional regulator
MLGEKYESLIMFHGPHAYISPRLYESRESVPTWNYAAVHVYGRATVLTDPAQLSQLLLDMIARFDSSYAQQWLSLREQYRSRMLQHIVGFELIATRVETKFKLSQNRTRIEQEKVIQSLACSSDSTVSAVAALMRERGLGTS